MKRFLLLALFVIQWVQSQNHKITGVFSDPLHKIQNVALYKLEEGDTKYLKYAVVKKDTFQFNMDSLATGYYRAFYTNAKTGHVDFIYNKENVLFTVHSKVGQESTSYLESRENQLADSYYYNLGVMQQKLDSVQMAYFKNPEKQTASKYKEIQTKIEGAQNYYENLAKDDYCLGEIKASKIYNTPKPFELPHDYVESIITHYFDYIDFSDERLRNASLLVDKISQYIFYLHETENPLTQNIRYVKAIEDVLLHTNDDTLKELILRYLTQQFVAKENNEVLQKTLEDYKNLPKEVQKIAFIKETEMVAKVILGVKAPNLEISKNETLYDLEETDRYLVIFWSSTCSHCLKELPEVKKLISNHPEVTVVAVGLEKKGGKDNWAFESSKFKEWKHVISFGKWKSKAANDYNVHATPSYYLLNKEKIIMAKPDDVKQLELLLKK